MTTKTMKFQSYQNFGMAGNFNSETNESDIQMGIKGFAIHPGTYHEIFDFPESELENAAKTIMGAKLLKTHNHWSLESVIGEITNSAIKKDNYSGLNGVEYIGYIDTEVADEGLIKRIQKQLIDATSIGFEFEPECGICGKNIYECDHWVWDEEFSIITRNVNVYELSLVLFGADSNATVESMNSNLDKTLKKDLENQLKTKFEKIAKNKKSDIMDKTEDQLKQEIIELNKKVTELEAQKESQEEIEQFKNDFEEKLSEKDETIANLQNEKEEINTELLSAKTELKVYKDKIEEIENAKLEEKKFNLLNLHKECTGEETLDGIEDLNEESVNSMIATYKKISEKFNKKTPKKFDKNKEYRLPYGNSKIAELHKEGKYEQALGEGIKEYFKKL